jgi:glyoxylase I family protein
MALVRGFHHVAIQARDVETVAAFYRDVLGLPELRRWPDERGGLRSIWLACGDGFLAIEATGEGETPSRLPFRHGAPGLHVFAFRIERGQRSAIESQLSARGIQIEHHTRWSLFLRDPEGNRVGLTHYPEESASGPA